jgi:hypothetical protein
MHSIAVEYGWPDYQPTIRTVATVDRKVLAQYAGTYELQPGFNIVITLDNNQLMGQATGQGKIQLYAASDTRFFLTVVNAEIEFFKDDQGKVSYLVLHQGGREMKAPKK